MEMKLEIHTQDGFLAYELMGENQLKNGNSKEISDGVSLRYDGRYFRKALDFPTILFFTLNVVADIATIIMAVDWLIEKLRSKKVEKIVIDEIEVGLDVPTESRLPVRFIVL